MSTKISALTAYTTPIATDLFPIVDITGSETKKITWADLFKAPTFQTSLTGPLLIGGTGTTSTLTYRATSGVGTTGADHIFQVGNNGATEAMRISNGGELRLGIATTGASRLYVYNAAQSSGVLSQFTTTQTIINASDTGDAVMSAYYTLSASSATNQLVSRGIQFAMSNGLTGGGILSNARGVNITYTTAASTTTTTWDAIYIDSGTASGTVTTGRGLTIAGLQGTTKYGIYDVVGTNWVNASGGTLNIGSASATASCIATFTSTTGAVLLPRMTTVQRDALTPLAGMVIYNTSTNKLNVYTTAWEAVTSA